MPVPRTPMYWPVGVGPIRDDRHLADLNVVATLHMEKLLEIRGLTLFVAGQSNDGGGLSERFVGEHGVRVGLLDLNAEFDVSDLRALEKLAFGGARQSPTG